MLDAIQGYGWARLKVREIDLICWLLALFCERKANNSPESCLCLRMWSANNDEQDSWRFFCVRRCLALAGGYSGKNGWHYERKVLKNWGRVHRLWLHTAHFLVAQTVEQQQDHGMHELIRCINLNLIHNSIKKKKYTIWHINRIN